MMISTSIDIDMPLQTDEHGTIRVGGYMCRFRIYDCGFSSESGPDEIVHNFPVLKVADIYHIIGYYLVNRGEVDLWWCCISSDNRGKIIASVPFSISSSLQLHHHPLPKAK